MEIKSNNMHMYTIDTALSETANWSEMNSLWSFTVTTEEIRQKKQL